MKGVYKNSPIEFNMLLSLEDDFEFIEYPVEGLSVAPKPRHCSLHGSSVTIREPIKQWRPQYRTATICEHREKTEWLDSGKCRNCYKKDILERRNKRNNRRQG